MFVVRSSDWSPYYIPSISLQSYYFQVHTNHQQWASIPSELRHEPFTSDFQPNVLTSKLTWLVLKDLANCRAASYGVHPLPALHDHIPMAHGWRFSWRSTHLPQCQWRSVINRSSLVHGPDLIWWMNGSDPFWQTERSSFLLRAHMAYIFKINLYIAWLLILCTRLIHRLLMIKNKASCLGSSLKMAQ